MRAGSTKKIPEYGKLAICRMSMRVIRPTEQWVSPSKRKSARGEAGTRRGARIVEVYLSSSISETSSLGRVKKMRQVAAIKKWQKSNPILAAPVIFNFHQS